MYRALQQILDVAPGFEDRSLAYSSRIHALLEAFTSQNKHALPPLWKVIPADQWSSHEITTWIHDAADELDIPAIDKELLLERLPVQTGSDLLSLSCGEFLSISQKYGEHVYQHLHRTMTTGKRRKLSE